MNLKKAIVAILVVSGMLAALAGPIPAGAEAAQEKQQEQQQAKSKEVKIDKKLAARLQKAVKQFAGKEIKLQDAAESITDSDAKVTSIDGKYVVHFDYKKGEVWSIDGTVPLDKISKEAQEEVLKVLKEAYAKKTYVLDKEVVLTKPYDGKKEKLKDYFSYTLTGKDFEAIWSGTGFVREVTIKLAKEELDSKWLETAAKAMKTAFDHDLNVTAAYLVSVGENYYMLSLKDNDVSLEMEAKKGKVLNVYHKTRKKVTTNQEVTEKDAKEVVAPLAKELFNIDISGLEAKWDNKFKDYYFVKGKETVLRAALDADKNAVYIISGG